MDRVGTHIGDLTRFVQTLGDTHGLRDGKAQLTGGFLLQGRGGEGGCRGAAGRLAADVFDDKSGRLELLKQGQCLLLVGELVGIVGLEGGHAAVAVGHHEDDRCLVIRFRLEMHDFALAFHNQSHSHRLYAAGRQGGLDALPQDGRQFETHQAVQHAAGLLGVDQVGVDAAGMLDGLLDGILGDLVENNAAGMVVLQAQDIEQMPGDGFSFAVFIGSQPDGLGLAGGLGQFADQFLLVGRKFVQRLESMIYIYAESFLAQVPDMTEARHHFVVLSQEAFDSLGFGGRFDND